MNNLPCRSLRVVADVVTCVRVDKGAQWTSIDHQPRDERAELLWGVDVDLEHAHRMWTNRFLEDRVDSQLGDCLRSVNVEGVPGRGRVWLAFTANPLVELFRKTGLGRVGLQEVDVNVEAGARSVGDRPDEGAVCFTPSARGIVDQRLCVRAFCHLFTVASQPASIVAKTPTDGRSLPREWNEVFEAF